MMKRPCEVVEGVIRGLLVPAEVPLSEILIGLNNAMAHGSCLADAGMKVPDKQLSKFFEGLDICIKAAKKIEKANN
jgi:hypothetical protein